MIRFANKGDIEAVYELGSLLHENFRVVNHLEKLMEEEYFKLFVAEEEEKIVGFLSITELYETVDIIDLFVLESYRRQKIASHLINYMIGSIGPNVSLITLEVSVSNHSAIALYKKFGFDVICKRLFYYGSTDAYLMGRECKR